MAIINARSTYRNPLTVVNTEADDVYINALNKIGQVASNKMMQQQKQETERQKAANEWIKWTSDRFMKESDKAYDDLKQAGVNNPQLSSMIMEQINIMSQLEGSARQASSPEEQKELLRQVSQYKARLSSGMATIAQMNDAIAAYNEDSSKAPNSQGNINLSNPKALEWAQKMAITSGKNPGTTTWLIDDDGDWALRHEGPKLKEPTITKAAVFFGYEPGIIPESDKDISSALDQIQFYNKDKVSQRYLYGQNVEGQLIPNIEYIDVGDGRMQGINRTNMEAVIANLVPVLHSTSDGYASDYYEAEAYWDGLPQNIQDEVNAELKRNGMKKVGEDLSIGNFQQTQLDEKSLLAIRQALVLQAKSQIRPFNTVGSPIKKDDSGGGNNDGNNNNNDYPGLSRDAIDFIKQIEETPIEQVVQQLRNLDPDGVQKVTFNKSKNQVTIDNTGTEEGGITVYDLDDITDFNVEAIAANQGDAGQFFMLWIKSKLGGDTYKERNIIDEVNTYLSREYTKDPNSGVNIPFKQSGKYNRR